MPGYCLRVYGNGSWAVVAGTDVLSRGDVAPAPFNSSAPHTLSLAAAGSEISASIDGLSVSVLDDTQFTAGSAAIGGGWQAIAFDSISLAAAVPVTAPASGQTGSKSGHGL